MIRMLAFLFGFLAAYGAVTAHPAGALLALLMIGLCLYAERHFAEQDRLWDNDPANAHEVTQDAVQDLERHECECIRAKDQL